MIHKSPAAGIRWLVLSVSAVDVGPASMLVGNLVAGKRIAQAIGRELGVVEDQDLIRKVPFFTDHESCGARALQKQIGQPRSLKIKKIDLMTFFFSI